MQKLYFLEYYYIVDIKKRTLSKSSPKKYHSENRFIFYILLFLKDFHVIKASRNMIL